MAAAAAKTTFSVEVGVLIDEEEIFQMLFDLSRLCEFSQPSSEDQDQGQYQYQYPPHSPLSELIKDIPSFIETFSLDRPDPGLFNMSSSSSSTSSSFHAEDEVRTASDYSAHSPPGLIQGGSSSSSSDGSGSPGPIPEVGHESPQYHDASLGEARARDDEWTYPQTERPKSVMHGYPSHLQVQDDQSKRGLAPVAGIKRRRSGNDLEKRPRQLVDPDQTADVRKTMAWPVMAKIPDIWSGHAKEEEQLCAGPRFYTGKPRKIKVFFAKDTTSPPLSAVVQAYRSQEETKDTSNLTKADFPRDNVPTHQALQKWVEDQIQREQSGSFRYAVQNFLLVYSECGFGLPKHSLVNKVHRMNCFFRILKTPSFWCLDPTNKLTNLPLSVQAQLRNIARKGLYSLEHDILKELDDCLTQQGPPKAQERMAVWASMWQLILMYRELAADFKNHISRLQNENREPSQNITQQSHMYKWLTESFFPLLTVFYHYQFRTKKSVEMSLDWLTPSAYPAAAMQGQAFHVTAQNLINSRKDFYVSLQSSKNETDELLCIFVINHELKKMNARKRTPRAPTLGKKGVDDNCDEDGE
ncbi:hypothetical protein ESCO_004741 [Escovopsis weberi]|uniref:Uncharacterized protein n=1 Tax=Escovopsis weberi TaxID=150374 RepID=A0A0M9VRQ7_ESCWE|nr:hypothetical protein ESCO_004741 [Escovopsis weberi]